jgi:spore maturation protein SpmA
VLNGIYIALVLGSILAAAFGGRMPALTQSMLESAKLAVTTAFGLIGAMCLWLGLMRVLRDAGFLHALARGASPLLGRLFPDVPRDHPAMAAMTLNLASNVLGLGNAATPFGLKAMQELERLNPRKGVITDAMALFLAINTAGVAVLPLGVIAIRSSLGSQHAAAITAPSLLATACSTLVAIALAIGLSRLSWFAAERYAEDSGPQARGPRLADAIPGLAEAEATAAVAPAASSARSLALALFLAVLAVAAARELRGAEELGTALRNLLEHWLLPLLMGAIVLYGWSRRVVVYDSFIAGAREGFQIFVTILPFLVGILVAIGMFRASGVLDASIALVAPITRAIGFPPEALPMALIRPLSGSGGMAVLVETLKSHGPDSFVGYLVSVINGSTETTFYVLALYCGSVGIRATRHTLAACLATDVAGILAAYGVCRIFFPDA